MKYIFKCIISKCLVLLCDKNFPGKIYNTLFYSPHLGIPQQTKVKFGELMSFIGIAYRSKGERLLREARVRDSKTAGTPSMDDSS